MIKECEKPSKLKAILDASKSAKSIAEISRLTSISTYYVNKLLEEFPGKKMIVTAALQNNKESRKRSLTPEQQEIFDMFMKMAENKKRKVESNKVTDIPIESDSKNSSQITRYISLPIRKTDSKDVVSIRLKNDSYNQNRVIDSKRHSKIQTCTGSTFLCQGDDIYSIRFNFSNGHKNSLSFRHLKIVNLKKENNAEIIYHVSIFSKNDLKKIVPIYQSFVKKFIDTHGIKF